MNEEKVRSGMKFTDLNLRVGSRMQLQIAGQDYKRHGCQAKLLGYRSGTSIMVMLMQKPPQVVLQDGVEVEARLAVPAGLVDFSSSILHTCESPFRYIHLDYPAEISLKPLRTQTRFHFQAPLIAVGQTSLGIRIDDIKGVFLDISQKGARVALDKNLGEIVTGIELETDIEIAGSKQTLQLLAEIKRNFGRDEERDEFPFVYGVSFDNATTPQQLLLMALCYELNNTPAANFY